MVCTFDGTILLFYANVCVARVCWEDLYEDQRVCLRLGGPLIYCLYVALTHVPSVALISRLIVWDVLLTLTIQCYDRCASPPSIELSPLFCLSQWGQLLSTIAWTQQAVGNGPALLITADKELWAFWTKLCSGHCALLENAAELYGPWNNAYSSSLFILSVAA